MKRFNISYYGKAGVQARDSWQKIEEDLEGAQEDLQEFEARGLRDFGRTPSRVTSHIPLFLPLLPPNSTASLAGRHITTERNLPFKFLASQKRPLHQPLVNPSNKHGLDGGVSGGGDLNHTLKTEHRKKMVPLVGKPCCNEHAYSAGRPTRRVQWEGTSPSSRHSGNKTRGVPSHKGTAEVGPPPASRCLARSPPPTA
ncbi:hypothetical protein RJZ56_001241 [Blastomyces dermatitidis]|uniref:Uncharacterized protein n=1 Tax=Ajellomyces dermatitidis (strain ATCC 18188 / CBS 674.68) TaxID=653446 RepID=A0A0J9EKS3_AJEDA|nr:hypothetical protein BDDG_11813 [Blastomyces dermatitidis ATCC 18188]